MWWWSNYISCHYFRFSFSTVFVDYSCSAFGPAYRRSFYRAGVVRPSTPPYTFCLSWYRFLKNYQFFFFDYSRKFETENGKKFKLTLYTKRLLKFNRKLLEYFMFIPIMIRLSFTLSVVAWSTLPTPTSSSSSQSSHRPRTSHISLISPPRV